MCQSIRKVEVSLGKNEKNLTKSEKPNFRLIRKSIVAKKFIYKGEILNLNNITLKRPAGGLGPEQWDYVIGKVAKKNFKEDEFIQNLKEKYVFYYWLEIRVWIVEKYTHTIKKREKMFR